MIAFSQVHCGACLPRDSGLVSAVPFAEAAGPRGVHHFTSHGAGQAHVIIKMALHLDSRCVLLSDPSTDGCRVSTVPTKTRLHTPEAATYHESNVVHPFIL